MTFVSNLINGISLGSVYAIIALGYTMVYGIAKMLNFAHGDIIMVGGYYIAECIMLGSFTSPAAAIPFNFIQAAASVPIPCILVPILRKLLRKNIL